MNAKRDLMKEINAKVARKKQMAKQAQASRQKTVATWVAEFFTEFAKIQKIHLGTQELFLSRFALNKLSDQLHNLDPHCLVSLRYEATGAVIEIRWSTQFVEQNSCEETLVLDASSAFFQSAMENF